jgi:hypothetical protein
MGRHSTPVPDVDRRLKPETRRGLAPPQGLPINVQDVVLYTPINVIVSSLKNELNEAYGEGNFTLRWADDDDDAPGL